MRKRTRGAEHCILPDTQCREDTPNTHLYALGNYVVDRMPDTIIHLGDHWDMHSLSSYDKGRRKGEGARYRQDIEAGIRDMEAFLAPINHRNTLRVRAGLKPYKPRFEFLIGNHEQRIDRYVEANPELEGVCTYDDFNLEKMGWHVNDFLVPVEIDGVTYAHYFYNQGNGNAIGGNAHYKLGRVGFSFTMGHVQGLDTAIKSLANGRILRALVTGSFYQHYESYKGPQGNDHWRGAIYKHEVRNGDYSLMELTNQYLLDEWL